MLLGLGKSMAARVALPLSAPARLLRFGAAAHAAIGLERDKVVDNGVGSRLVII
jgi:hypothetical protein